MPLRWNRPKSTITSPRGGVRNRVRLDTPKLRLTRWPNGSGWTRTPLLVDPRLQHRATQEVAAVVVNSGGIVRQPQPHPPEHAGGRCGRYG